MTTEHDRLVGTLARVDRAAERLAEARASLAAAVEDCAPTRLSIPGRIVAVVDDGKITEWRFLPWASDAGYCGDPYEVEEGPDRGASWEHGPARWLDGLCAEALTHGVELGWEG